MMAQSVIRAEVDSHARLMRGDAALVGLQARAGGIADGPLVIPQLARLTKLAIRLGTPISRPVLAGDDDCDISMWVRVVPHDSGASLEIVDWTETERAGRVFRSDAAIAATPPLTLATVLVPQKSWQWSCNAQLRMTRLVLADGQEDTTLGRWLGHSLSECFKLQPDENGQFPLLTALAGQQGFEAQSVKAVLDEDRIVQLEGMPVTDSRGQFAGYTGTAAAAVEAAPDNARVEQAVAPEVAPVAGDNPGADDDDDELMLTDIVPDGEAGDSAPDNEDSSSLLGFGSRVGDFSRRIDGALRRPLGRIIANAETISGKLEGPIRQDYADYASDIAAAGRHLMGLIDDLADLQAIERPDFCPAREDVDLADMGRRTAGLLAMKAREKDIRIDAPDMDESVMATGEFRRVLQILINLVGNAIRYSPEGSQIWIRAEHKDGRAMITVADQGRGISADEQGRIFEKFERLGRDDHGGSGLGLYIARRLARAMDGDIMIDSAPGQGARFSLTLPGKE